VKRGGWAVAMLVVAVAVAVAVAVVAVVAVVVVVLVRQAVCRRRPFRVMLARAKGSRHTASPHPP
jgi:hypothetical protein